MQVHNDVDAQARALWTIVALLGAILSVIGWLRFIA
jgi:hypothetical protein